MKIQSLHQNYQPQFQPKFKGLVSGKNAGEFVLKKRNVPYWEMVSFLTACTSMIGFAVGGSGLTSDWLNDLSKKKTKNNLVSNANSKSERTAFSAFSNSKTVTENVEKTSKKSKEGAKTIVRGTPFSKLGLKFAKIG